MPETSLLGLISKWLIENDVKHALMKGSAVDWIDVPCSWNDNYGGTPDYTIEINKDNAIIELQIWDSGFYRTIGSINAADSNCFKLLQPIIDKYANPS